MIIRRATESDFKNIAEIGESIYHAIKNKAQFNWPREALVNELKSVNTLVVESGEEVVSFLCYRDLPDVLEISALATKPLMQKNNFQTVLIQFLQGLAAEQQKYIILEVHQDNTIAQGLYQKMGFLLLYSRKRYYSDKGDALVMRWDNNKAGC